MAITLFEIIHYSAVVENIKYECKNNVYKNGYRRRTCSSKTAKIHCFDKLVTYCIITTCSVECYWQCSDGTVHYKSEKKQCGM